MYETWRTHTTTPRRRCRLRLGGRTAHLMAPSTRSQSSLRDCPAWSTLWLWLCVGLHTRLRYFIDRLSVALVTLCNGGSAITLPSRVSRCDARCVRVRRNNGRIGTADRGQTTAEYALVIVGAAAVALVLLAWATGSGQISRLLDKMVGRVADMVS